VEKSGSEVLQGLLGLPVRGSSLYNDEWHSDSTVPGMELNESLQSNDHLLGGLLSVVKGQDNSESVLSVQ